VSLHSSAVILLLATAVAADQMQLQLFSRQSGALCLDGTPAGYYYSTNPNQDPQRFVIYFEGGGWCYDMADCANRALHYDIGSSQNWTATMTPQSVVSGDAKTNPQFSSFTRIWVPYCDGYSFMGYREQPVAFGSQLVYFRGATVLKELLVTLDAKFRLTAARDVLVSGCSAGGLSAILHVDRIRAFVPAARRVASVPDSGFFLNATNVGGAFEYGAQMASGWRLHNATGGANLRCVAARGDTADCAMAPYVLPHVRAPVFLLNSIYDQWQMGNVVGDGVPQASSFQSKCVDHGPRQCNATELAVANAFRTQLTADALGGLKKTDGFALESCWTHCQMWSDFVWSTYAINGHLVRDVVAKWWAQLNGGGVPSVQWRLLDCNITTVGQQSCNNMCPVWN
jgi:hypothetical protein